MVDVPTPLALSGGGGTQQGGERLEATAKCRVEFMKIDNVHVVRDSFRRLCALATAAAPTDGHWLAAVEATNWLRHLRTILAAAVRVARALHCDGRSVLVHCSDGWDRTAQVCSLVELLLDPYYRTIEGFAVLVEREWVSFGHRFAKRVGHADSNYGDDHRSPVFLQWLDCVWQLRHMLPQAFGFSGALLLFVAHHLYSCRFGTFLMDSDREREQLGVQRRTYSLWHCVQARRSQFVNPFYLPGAFHELVPPVPAVTRAVTLWADYFLRFSPVPSFPALTAPTEPGPAAAAVAPLPTHVQARVAELAAALRDPAAAARAQQLERGVALALLDPDAAADAGTGLPAQTLAAQPPAAAPEAPAVVAAAAAAGPAREREDMATHALRSALHDAPSAAAQLQQCMEAALAAGVALRAAVQPGPESETPREQLEERLRAARAEVSRLEAMLQASAPA